jgi:uncharacterized protein (TIGR03437 family)
MNPGRPNEVASATATARIQNFSPAFFTFNGRSVAALVAGTSTIVADPSLAIAGSRAARPGEIVELYATGLGATQTAVAPGAVSPGQAISTTGTVTVTIGGTAVTPMYAGLAPGNISGLYQINVPIPANAANGDLPIAMAIGGEQSVAGTTIPVRAQ